MKHGETQEQQAYIKWTKYIPELRFLHCSLNGVRLSATQARIAKSTGMVAGIPDVFLPLPRGKYHGLYIEFKFGRNKLTDEQKEFREYALANGYQHHICYSWLDAKQLTEQYLKEL